MRHKELRDLRELGMAAAGQDLPAYLAGLPDCLHKYGPLFAEQLSQTAAPDEASAA